MMKPTVTRSKSTPWLRPSAPGLTLQRVGAVTCVLVLIVALCDSAISQTRRQPTRRPRSVAAPESSPQDQFDRARAATAQDDRIALLDKFLSTHAGAPQATEARELLMREYALRGEQHLREGSPQLAARDFRSLIRILPPEVDARIFGQFIFPLPMAMNAFGYRDESVQLMRSFESRFSNDVNRMVQIGFFYVQIEAPLEAVRVLERTVKVAPEDHRARNSLGTAYLINLRLEDAAAEFEKALELNPEDEYANLNLANLARASSDHQTAVEYYGRQLRVQSQDAEAMGGMAISLLALGRDEEAQLFIDRATKLAPENYRFLTQLAFFYINRRKPAAARPLLEKAAGIEPRYAWLHIAKANLDLMESKWGEGLSTIIAAQTVGSFATLKLELAKALMAVDGYDQALEALNQAFKISDNGEFEAVLGGVVRARSPRIDLLLERERKAALMLGDYPTTNTQYRLLEALARIDHYAKTMLDAREAARKSTGRRGRPVRRGGAGRVPADQEEATRPRRATQQAVGSSLELTAGADSKLPGAEELIHAVTIFTTLDDGRQPFRMLWVARKLNEMGIALDAVERLSRHAIAAADEATGPTGSVRDAPLLDREARRAVFLGRAHDALGWALFKKGDIRGALDNLSRAVANYPPGPEHRTALWHLAVATAEAGDERRALEFYIASYEPKSPTAEARLAQIKILYKKINGSLTGLEERLKQLQ